MVESEREKLRSANHRNICHVTQNPVTFSTWNNHVAAVLIGYNYIGKGDSLLGEGW
jgi:hypothetical protein